MVTLIPNTLVPATVSVHLPVEVCLLSYGERLFVTTPVDSLQVVIERYETPWFWHKCSGLSNSAWVADALANSTLISVTDGSHMRNLDSTATSMAYTLMCTSSGHTIMGSFAKTSNDVSAYKGELLGLLAIHLLLEQAQSIYGTSPLPTHLYSKCQSAINKINQLSPNQISTKLQQFDILKLLSLARLQMGAPPKLLHVRTHQDDHSSFQSLSLPAQLNCKCDSTAKRHLLWYIYQGHKCQYRLPLELITVFVATQKATMDKSHALTFHIHWHLARVAFHQKHILDNQQLDEVDWEHVSAAIHKLLRLFQLWASKQVMGAASTMAYLHHQDGCDPWCPSCLQDLETAAHILLCQEGGRTKAFCQAVREWQTWCDTNSMDPQLRDGLSAFIIARGDISMSRAFQSLPHHYVAMATLQDNIGWQRFMEGMVTRKLKQVQQAYLERWQTCMTIGTWMTGFIQQLLMIMHKQWKYRNSGTPSRVWAHCVSGEGDDSARN